MSKKKSFLRQRHKTILEMIKEQWVKLFLAMGCMIVVASSTAVTAFLVKPILDEIFFNRDVAKLTILPIFVIVVYFLRGFGIYGQEYLMNYVGENIICRLRAILYNKIMDLPLSFFHKEKTGGLMSRITNDVNIVKTMVSTAVTSSLRDVFTVLGLIFVIFYRDFKLAFFALIIMPIAFYPVVKFGRRVRKVSKGCQESMADLSSFLHETFSGNKIVKAFAMEEFEKNRFFEKNNKMFKLEIKSVVAKSLTTPVMEFLGGLGVAFIIWYGGYGVIKGSSTPGTFFSFLAAVIMLYDPLKKLSKLNNSIQQGLAASDRVFDIIETESDIKESFNPKILEKKPLNVKFENVCFKYEDEMVLKNINLDIKTGEVLAIVGMSGGGKTSLVNLIPRFFDSSSGKIYIDGIDIKEISILSLRKQIAIVTQEPILFNDTVEDNISYGNKDATFEAIEKSAKDAYAYDFIQGFPKGFKTMIGELGSRLSGGEKQRICIARALLKDAPILILDEATSALDSEAEMIVQKAIENLMKGRTTFIIAHRLSTIRAVDRIIVLSNGEIIEQGTHEELMHKNGDYSKLYNRQMGHVSDETELSQ
ncbi:MAG: ABC transporter ATP-binding protein [Desulfobacterales bacterium]|nr:ABC transporter ATP-binding protein [Desulfobacterales bacterium]